MGNGLLLLAGPGLPLVDNSGCICPLEFIVDNGFATTQTVNGLPVHVASTSPPRWSVPRAVR